MSTQRSVDRVTGGEPQARGRSRLAWVVAAVAVAAFGGWFGMRVKTAMATQQALAAERAEVARAADKPSGPVAKQAVTGVPGSWQPEVQLEGTLEAVRESDLSFDAPGRLAAIKVRLGEHVSQGEVLATLDAQQAQAQVQAAEAQVRAAEAQLALADDNAGRTEKLLQTGVASQASGVQSSQQRSLATAQLDGARAQLALARVSLQHHALTAPFSGSVTRVPAGPGAIVNPGQPLFHLADTGLLRLSGTVSEADAPLVKPGAPVEIRLDGRTVRGEVVAVLGAVDAATRRVPVEAQVKNDTQPPLLAGAFVRATVAGLKAVPVLTLPGATLRPGSQNEVMVVRDGRLHARRISFQRAADGALVVRAGLDAGEQVLLSPSPEAQDGDGVVLSVSK